MKKIILLLSLIATLISCTNAGEEKEVVSNIFIENKVNQFVKENADWTVNDKVQEPITDKFKHAVINWSNEPEFLNGMPLQFIKMRDTLLSEAPFKVATFTGYNDNNRKMGSIMNYIQIQIDAIVPSTIEKNLVINKNYHITGTLYKQGKRGDVKYISVADFKGYDLGKYLFSLTSAKAL